MTISAYGKAPENLKDRQLIRILFEDLLSYYEKIFVWQPFLLTITDLIADKSKILSYNSKEELLKLQQLDSDNPHILLSLGGDGTMLDTVDYVIGTNISVLGINLGHLGFLTTAGRNDIKNLVKEITNHRYTIEQRSILEAKYSFDCKARKYAVNEACFLSNDTGNVVDIELFINDKYVSTFSGDGLLVATPTGSTAYSMSAGGPIITPKSKCLCITPIAPHNLTFRPVIISENDIVKIQIPNSDNLCKMLMDGHSVFKRSNEYVILQKAPYDWNLIRLIDHDFFLAIRNKLMWGTVPKYLNE